MKKVLLLVCVVISIMLASCDSSKKNTYSEDEMREAIDEAEYYAYKEGYERGYDEAEYYLRPDLLKEEAERAYEAGYERGYEEGYDDCLEEHGLVEESSFNPNDPPRIKKDK